MPAQFTKINNRKILEGYYSGLDMENTSAAIRLIDKVDKIGFDGVADLLKIEWDLIPKLLIKFFNSHKFVALGSKSQIKFRTWECTRITRSGIDRTYLCYARTRTYR